VKENPIATYTNEKRKQVTADNRGQLSQSFCQSVLFFVEDPEHNRGNTDVPRDYQSEFEVPLPMNKDAEVGQKSSEGRKNDSEHDSEFA
jgi:hypothetical protein